MKPKIESGIPLPAPQNIKRVYPFAEMAVGDSFLIACASTELPRVQSQVAGAAHTRTVKHEERFATRRTEDGVRCWRIK